METRGAATAESERARRSNPITQSAYGEGGWMAEMNTEDVVFDALPAEHIAQFLRAARSSYDVREVTSKSSEHFFHDLWEPTQVCPDWNIVLKRITQLTTLLIGGTTEQANQVAQLSDRQLLILHEKRPDMGGSSPFLPSAQVMFVRGYEVDRERWWEQDSFNTLMESKTQLTA